MAGDRTKLMTEKKVKEIVHEWYKANYGFSWAPVSNGMGVHGIPDRVGCVPIVVTPDMVGKKIGLFVAVESKGEHRKNHEDGGRTPNQTARSSDIRWAGGVCLTAHDASIDQELYDLIGRIQFGKGTWQI